MSRCRGLHPVPCMVCRATVWAPWDRAYVLCPPCDEASLEAWRRALSEAPSRAA